MASHDSLLLVDGTIMKYNNTSLYLSTFFFFFLKYLYLKYSLFCLSPFLHFRAKYPTFTPFHPFTPLHHVTLKQDHTGLAEISSKYNTLSNLKQTNHVYLSEKARCLYLQKHIDLSIYSRFK